MLSILNRNTTKKQRGKKIQISFLKLLSNIYEQKYINWILSSLTNAVGKPYISTTQCGFILEYSNTRLRAIAQCAPMALFMYISTKIMNTIQIIENNTNFIVAISFENFINIYKNIE